jgi:hypothetical protein
MRKYLALFVDVSKISNKTLFFGKGQSVTDKVLRFEATKSAARNFNEQQHIRKASDEYHRLYVTVIFSSVILGCLILRAGFCSLKLRAADSLPVLRPSDQTRF